MSASRPTQSHIFANRPSCSSLSTPGEVYSDADSVRASGMGRRVGARSACVRPDSIATCEGVLRRMVGFSTTEDMDGLPVDGPGGSPF